MIAPTPPLTLHTRDAHGIDAPAVTLLVTPQTNRATRFALWDPPNNANTEHRLDLAWRTASHPPCSTPSWYAPAAPTPTGPSSTNSIPIPLHRKEHEMTHSQTIRGRSARTNNIHEHRITWEPQRITCCGEIVKQIDDTPPVYLDGTDAEPRSRVYQCGTCGTQYTAEWRLDPPANEVAPQWWIATAETAIMGYGSTPTAAVDSAVSEAGYASRDDYISDIREQHWADEDQADAKASDPKLGFTVQRATPALIVQIELEGGAIAWGGLTNGNACTVEEEEASNT